MRQPMDRARGRVSARRACFSRPRRWSAKPKGPDLPVDGSLDTPTNQTPDLSILEGDGRLSAPALPLEVFGPAWSEWLVDAAKAAASSVDYVASALLASASALIGNARWVRAWPGWEEPPHLWCAAVGNSGQGKSPGADIILRHIIPAIEARMLGDFAVAQEERMCFLRAHDLEDPISETIEPRFLESDLTIEKVAAILAGAAPKGLLMVRDELAGWLNGMNRFNAGARAFWLEAYGGRPYRVDRVKSPARILVPHLAVAWHGGIQPERLAKLMGEADDGLLARFIWFWPGPVPFQRPKVIPNLPFALSAFERLSMLEMRACEGSSHPQPIPIPLCENAAARLEAFAQEIQSLQANTSGLMTSALGKARGLALRLSLVLAYLNWAAENGSTQAPAIVGEEALNAAIRFVKDYVLPMAERSYGKAAVPQDKIHTQTLARHIIQTRACEIHVRTLQRRLHLPGLTRAPGIHAACQTLVRAGWLKPPPPGSRHGRARQAYVVHPKLWRTLNRFPL